jgi:hypothetical protein
MGRQQNYLSKKEFVLSWREQGIKGIVLGGESFRRQL